MTDLGSATMPIRPPLSTLEKTTTLAAWFLAGGIFLSVGWMAMAPDDPLGAVSLLTRHHGGAMLAQAAALAVISAGIATLLIGRRLADVGAFSAAVGLACVSLRGDTAQYLLMFDAPAGAGSQRSVALSLAVEACAWWLVVFAAMLVSALVLRWCSPARPPVNSDHVDASPGDGAQRPAAADVPLIGTYLLREADPTPPAVGGKHTAVAAGIAILSFVVLSTGLSRRAVEHGQACFVVAAATFLACMVAQRLVPVRTSLWALLAVPVLALVGYGWSAVGAGSAGVPPTLPASCFLRVLPIQYAAVGAASVFATYWYMSPVPVGPAEGGGEAASQGRREGR
ncbi:MAG: hypothetical protein HY763_10525 [Planctomycetes bacterium]|nr:hypothetical protein [Planctomycetota bacterium]